MKDRELLELIAEQVGGLTNDMGTLKSDVTSLKEGQHRLENEVTSLKEDVTSLKKDVSDLKEDVTSLKEDVSGLKEDVTSLKEGQHRLENDVTSLKEGQQKLESEVQDIKETVFKIEQDHGTKISALFDGYSLRGDQNERMQQHFDKRLDAIQADLSYLVSKTAQHDRKFVQIYKANAHRKKINLYFLEVIKHDEYIFKRVR